MTTKAHYQAAAEEVADSKTLGNEAIKKQQYTEAALCYTKAIQIEAGLPKSYIKTLPQLYSNRSLAYLKLKQYSLALQDAYETIRLDPDWVEGYFRLAEVQFSTANFLEACKSYTIASQIHMDQSLIESAVKSHAELVKQEKFDRQIPWVAAGCGLIFGVILVLADCIVPNKSVFIHPVIQVAVTICISLAGLFVGHAYRWYAQSTRKAFLTISPAAPEGDSGEDKQNEKIEEKSQKHLRNHPRYTKAQANARYRRGKS